jgi:hypothetical protein
MTLFDRNNELIAKRRGWRSSGSLRRRREKDESEVRWLISYSDFMMQLVCLFILLYSVSSVDTSKAVPLAQAWRDEVGISEVRVPSAPKSPHAPLMSEDLPTVLHEIRILAGRHPGGGSLHVSRNADGFRLQFVYEMFDRRSERLARTGSQVADLASLLFSRFSRGWRRSKLVGHASADEGRARPFPGPRPRRAPLDDAARIALSPRPARAARRRPRRPRARRRRRGFFRPARSTVAWSSSSASPPGRNTT